MAKEKNNKKNKKGKARGTFPKREDMSERAPIGTNHNNSTKRSCIGGDNDVRWYGANPQLIKDTASYPFQFPLGTKHSLGASDTFLNATAVPGVCVIHWDPSVGMASQEVAAVNVAMRNIYSFIRHANSGKTNYEAPDLMLYLLAMSDVFSYHAMLKRIYGIALTYSHTNRYIPKALVEALGVDYDDIQEHLCDLRSYINTFAVRVGSFCVPASMPYIARHVWMNSHVYMDSQQDKPQLYAYCQDHFLQFGLDGDSAGQLTGLRFCGRQTNTIKAFQTDASATKGMSFAELAAMGDKLIAPIIVSEDFGIMSGDILKAYTPGEVYRIDLIPENYVVFPEYSEEVLDQINNCSLLGQMSDLAPFTISQTKGINKGYLTEDHRLVWFSNTATALPTDAQNWITNVMNPALTEGRFLNFERDDVKPEDVLVATRLSALPTQLDDIHYDSIEKRVAVRVHLDESVGSEVPLYARVLYYQNAEASKPQDSDNHFVLKSSEMIFTLCGYEIMSNQVVDAAGMSSLVSVFSYALTRAQLLTKFRRHPLLFEGAFASITPTGESAVGETTHPIDVLGDLNYYTVIKPFNLKQMSAMALLSEFDVTQFGRQA